MPTHFEKGKSSNQLSQHWKRTRVVVSCTYPPEGVQRKRLHSRRQGGNGSLPSSITGKQTVNEKCPACLGSFVFTQTARVV